MINRFDSAANTWDSNPNALKRTERAARAILSKPYFKPGVSALEYGCGTGLLSFALQAELGALCLADTSPGMLEVLRRKISASGLSKMQAVQLDLSEGPLPSARYGLIFSQMTMHHIKDVQGLLVKFHELLLPDGVLFIADLDKEDGSFHMTDPSFDGHNGFDRAVFGKMAERAGFRDIEFETIFEQPKEIAGVMRTFPLFLMGAKA